MSVPVLQAIPGSEYELFVWLLPDQDLNILGASWNLATNQPGAVESMYSVMDNPVNAERTRWWNVTHHSGLNMDLDPDGSGPKTPESLLVNNARGAVIVIGENPGIGSLSGHMSDSLRDELTGAFRLGMVRIRPDMVSEPVGLYLRQGTSLFAIRNGAGTTITSNVSLFFGDSLTPSVRAGSMGRNLGDPLSPDEVGADAIIVPVPEPSTAVLCGLGALGLALVARRRRSA